MMRRVRVIGWVLMFPLMLLIVNPLNDITTTIRDWWEAGPHD